MDAMDDKYRFEDEDRAAWDTVELHGLPWSPEEIAEIERETAELEAAYAEDAEHTARADADFCQPESALAFLTDCHGGEDCEGECPAPVTVLEVLTASTMRPSMRARVMCADGTVRTVRAWCHYSHGSQWEPPDADVGYEYE
jgi:hypothetical protein